MYKILSHNNINIIFDGIKKDNIDSQKKLMLQELSKLEDIQDNEIAINYSKLGKPFLKNSDLQISITHSGEYIAMSLSSKSIGIDLQENKDINDVLEKYILEGSEESDLDPLVMWTHKESCLKSYPDKDIILDMKKILFEKKIENKYQYVVGINNNLEKFLCYNLEVFDNYIFSIAEYEEK